MKAITPLLSKCSYLTSVICLTLAAAFGCSSMKAQQPPKPVLAIIGADISPSLTPYELLDTSHIRSVCMSMGARGGTVAFDVVGNPVTRRLLRLAILPNPPVDRTLPPSRRKEAEAKWKEIHLQNLRAIRTFSDSCYQRLSLPAQTQTDLNGFFERAGRLCKEPQFAGYNKVVYVNTDGYHSVSRKVDDKVVKDKALLCVLPVGTELWVSGWKSKDTCSAKYLFESPTGFTDFFQQQHKDFKIK